MRGWSVKDSVELYNIQNWGNGFFDVNEKGHIIATPAGPGSGAIDIHDLVEELEERGIQLPMLLRFTDIVKRRVEIIATAFSRAIVDYDYRGNYRGVYPIKVNQQAHLVEDLVRFCRPFHMGLEAGSKPELLVTLALLDDPEAYIVCNGYKDEEFIDTALLAQKLGRNPIIVIEKLSEVDLVLEVARRRNIRPMIGVRSKLSAQGRGHWGDSSGDKAKFGLTARDIVLMVKKLQDAGYLDCLRLLHFHIGSQVSAIRTIKEAVREAARTYVELVRMGAPMGIMDVGGGLGVDYDGSRTNYESSMNYSVDEYAADVVSGVEAACTRAGIPHPDIITESGRALVAHHSVLIFNVLGCTSLPTEGAPVEVTEKDPDPLRELREVYDEVTQRGYQEAWHDAQAAREEGLTGYNLGLLSLEDRARMEHLFWQVCGKIQRIVRSQAYVPDDLQGLERTMADVYYCNFSVFQSAPDAWAIGQLFPCVPIHRLDEKPTRRGVLADITCDSDGKLERFIDLRDVKDVLELHTLKKDQPYRMALFMVGAYQEILGDLHNLFGDTHAVHVSLAPDGSYQIDHVIEGDTVTEVLGYVQYNRKDLVHRVREANEKALKSGTMTLAESRDLMNAYQAGLDGYTYLEGGV